MQPLEQFALFGFLREHDLLDKGSTAGDFHAQRHVYETYTRMKEAGQPSEELEAYLTFVRSGEGI